MSVQIWAPMEITFRQGDHRICPLIPSRIKWGKVREEFGRMLVELYDVPTREEETEMRAVGCSFDKELPATRAFRFATVDGERPVELKSVALEPEELRS